MQLTKYFNDFYVIMKLLIYYFYIIVGIFILLSRESDEALYELA